MTTKTKRIIAKEGLILGLFLGVYWVLMLMLLLFAVIKFPSESFVKTFAALLPLTLISYLPFQVVRFIIWAIKTLRGK